MKRWSMLQIMGAMVLIWWVLPASALGDGELVELRQYPAASDQELDSQRGGFIINDGLPISFGVIQASSINGELLAINTWNGPQIDQIGGNVPTLIRNGQGNDFGPVRLDNVMPGGLTIIQNTLDQQVIRNMTIISAEVANSNVLSQTNLSLSLTNQMIHAIR